MTKNEQLQYDVAFGMHSDIPACCIMFFVREWDPSKAWDDEENWYHRAVDAAAFGYVPCPQCLGTNNRVKIKTCAVDCGGEHQKDFMPKEKTSVS